MTDGLGGVQFYFSLPHHPWQQGTNENTNELLRKYFPDDYDNNYYTNAHPRTATASHWQRGPERL